MGDLVPVLDREIELYERLGTLLDSEEEALVSLRLDEIRRLTQEKETLLLKIKVTEETRLKLLSPIAADLGRSPEEVTGREIRDRAAPKVREGLDRAIRRLAQIVESVFEKNRRNDRLLVRSQAAMQESYALLAALAGGGLTYGADGSLAGRFQQSVVVAREA